MPRIHLPRAARRRCYLTWTGFQLTPRGSRVFLQLNRRPRYKLLRRDGRLVLELPGCRAAHGNNLRPLITRYFDTPVLRVDVDRRNRRQLRLRIRLRGPVKPHLRVVQLQQWYYLFVTFSHRRGAPVRRVRAPASAAPPRRRAPSGPNPP
jgi:hypothetical protein